VREGADEKVGYAFDSARPDASEPKATN